MMISTAHLKFHFVEKRRKSEKTGQVWDFNHFPPFAFPKIEV